MKLKQLFLTLMMTILCAAQGWAAFVPQGGKTYYLYSPIAKAFLNTTGVTGQTTAVSYRSTPTEVEISSYNGGFSIKVVETKKFLAKSSSKDWDVALQNDAYVWYISDGINSMGYYISRDASANYLGNNNSCSLNSGIFCNGNTTNATWQIIAKDNAESVVNPEKHYRMVSPTGTYLKLETADQDGTKDNAATATSFVSDKANASVFTIEKIGSAYTFTDENGHYIGVKLTSGFAWNATNINKYAWTLVKNGDKYILQRQDGKYLGADDSDANTKLYTDRNSGTAWTFEDADAEDPVVPTGYTVYLHDLVKNLCLMQNDSYTTDTKAQFQYEGSAVTLTAVGGVDNGFTISLDGTGKYLSCDHNGSTGWKVISSNSSYTWIIEPVLNGWTIKASTKGSGSGLYLGQISGANIGSGIYSNQTSAFTWNFWTQTEYEQHLSEIGKTYTINVVGDVANGGVRYDGNDYTTSFSSYKEVTTGVLTAIPVAGYQANITMEGTVITVTYTRNQVVGNPQAISDMLNRIGGAGTSDKFVTRLDEGLFVNGKDKFIIGNQDSKPYIQGSSLTAIAAGINWYLNHDAHINISWNQLTADIAGASLPAATAVEKTCDADYRYYLNYCTFGYSMTTWTWDRWQKEIDWMALHGINMPLQIIGLEEVWRKLLVQYHYTDDEAKAFAAGPAFTAWWGMNNLEGWGGTTDDAWFARQAKLGKDICDRMKELGMQPVLPGFAAIVPHDFTSKNPAYASESQGNWGGSFVRPWIMDPSGEKFSEVAEKYYEALEDVLGTSKYYSMDPFHEGGAISSGKYSEGYKAIYDAMNTHCGSDTKWVIQQWQWAGGYQRNSLTAVPAGRLIVLDLFADGQPAFDSYNGYAPQEAVFSTIPNFGGRSGFMGRLNNMATNYFTYKGKYSTIKGIGAAPEAIESVPVVYDLLFELPWMGSAPNVTAWVADYATNRYGSANANAQKAWESIHQSAMAFGADAIQGPIEDVWAARPNLDATPASKWGKTIANAATIYTPERRQKLISAVYDLIGENANLSGSNYQYDIIEAGGQVMADYAYDLLLGIKAAKTANNTELFNKRKDAFLNLILGMDAFKGTHQMFRLGNWTQTARDAAAEVQGATTATPDWYELDNARTIITTWGDKGPSDWGLRDYSYRSWQGMLMDYYYPRWKYYFDHDCTAPSSGWFYSEWNWAHELEGEWGASAKGTQMKSERTYYSPTPEGNTVDEAEKLMAKYILPVQLNDKSIKYVYRALETDLTSVLTVDAVLGAQVALPIVGNTDIDGENVTVIVKLDGTELVNRTIPNEATKGEHNAEYIVSDSTVIRFKVNVDNTFSTGDITGNDKVHFMHAKDYITNVDGEGQKIYTKVPQGKAWQMVMDVTHTTGQKASYNKWGSCILSSSSDPFNTFYWNNFQVYEHSAPRKTLNFKSNKGDGNDHVIAQGHQVLTDAGYEDYRVIVRYDGKQTYLIRTIILDNEGNPTNQVFNNVWFAARIQHDIDVMSCALPTGTNLKNLAISIAEESNLLEDVDYAIQNITTKDYLSCDYQRGPDENEHYPTADHASKFQIEFTKNNDLAYHDGDGGLHPTIYIKAEVFNEETRNIEWKYLGIDNLPVEDKANAIPYLYSDNSKNIVPIHNTDTGSGVVSEMGKPWAIVDYNQWNFIFFGNYLIQISDNNVNVGAKAFGGITYKKNDVRNNEYIALPTSAQQIQIPNTSEIGYSATITMDGTMLRVNYTPLDDTFYNFTDLDLYGSGTTLYYWYKEQNKLVKYSTGTEDDWNELDANSNVINGKGDCTKWSIVKATTIPVTLSEDIYGTKPDHKFYSTIYCPNALVLPDGVSAFAATDNGKSMHMERVGENTNIVPAKTAVILRCDTYSGPVNLTLNTTDNSTLEQDNDLEGVFITIEKPTNKTFYTLSRLNGIGFYKYTGVYLNGFKAFCPSESTEARLAFDFDDLTSIEDIQGETVDATVFDLQGRRVSNITKGGIYIVNGKKVMK